MKKYLFKKEFPGRYLLREVPVIEGEKYRAYYVDYPSTNDDDNLNWSFFSMLCDNEKDYDCEDWGISKGRQEEIKNYIRTVLKPDDYNEYDFVNDIRGRVRVKSIEIDGGYEDYYIDYPCKEEGIKEWKFYIGKDNKRTNGEFVSEPWDISNLEAEYLKNIIRNELKPSDLCESEEKEMVRDEDLRGRNLKNRLVLVIPEEKHDYISRIVSEIIDNEDDFLVDDMIMDEYNETVKQRDELQDEIERLKVENRMLRADIAATSEKNEGKNILEMPLGEILEVVEDMKKERGRKVIVCKEN